jgi:hypothetical protein
MLVAIIYTGRDVCEDKEKRSLQLFSAWRRPYGATPGRQVGGHGVRPESGAYAPRDPRFLSATADRLGDPSTSSRQGGQAGQAAGRKCRVRMNSR